VIVHQPPRPSGEGLGRRVEAGPGQPACDAVHELGLLIVEWESVVIAARGLTKRYGDKIAVDNLTFDVKSCIVTGFLGPNGTGKSTTMRLILGLDRPTHDQALVNGRPYAATRAPLREVGALLEAGKRIGASLWACSSPWASPPRCLEIRRS
jgi:ABC-type multidrug transport system fused ATPase/permease subunit